VLKQAYDNARRLRNATTGFKLYNKRQLLVPLERVPAPVELRNTAVTSANTGVTAVGAGYAAIIRRLDEALRVQSDDDQQYYHAASTDSDIEDVLVREVASDTASDTDELTALEVDVLFTMLDNINEEEIAFATAETDDNSNDQTYKMFYTATRDQHTAIEFNHTQQYAAQREHDRAACYARPVAERLRQAVQPIDEPLQHQPQQQVQHQQQYM
jgi:hypothetical protein